MASLAAQQERFERLGYAQRRSVRASLKDPDEVEQRLLARRHLLGDCWIYTGYWDRDGYAQVKAQGMTPSGIAKVHRVAYVLWRGPLNEGDDVNHLCENRACFRPEHLEREPWLRHRVEKLS